MTSIVASDTLTGLAGEFAELVTRLQQVDLTPAATDRWNCGGVQRQPRQQRWSKRSTTPQERCAQFKIQPLEASATGSTPTC